MNPFRTKLINFQIAYQVLEGIGHDNAESKITSKPSSLGWPKKASRGKVPDFAWPFLNKEGHETQPLELQKGSDLFSGFERTFDTLWKNSQKPTILQD